MTTKKIIIATACLVTLLSQAQTTEKREISSFTKINASGASNIVYETAPATVLTIEGDENEIKNIETYVKNNTLYIKTKGNYTHPFKIKILNAKLDGLDLSGASKFIASTEVKAESFSIKASDASSIDMPLNAKKVLSDIEGASSIKLSGNTNEFVADLSGSSDLKASGLKSLNTSVTASGASSARVFASQKIFTNSSGASRIKFDGNPKEILKKETSVSK